MNKEQTLNRVKQTGLLAVLRGPTPDLTYSMVEALVAGGVIGIEVTYTTPNAVEVVQGLRQRFGDDILLGMGTLTELHQPVEAKQAGAAFIVSPVSDTDLVTAMVQSGLVVMAGALTPTEVLQAYRLGTDVVKIFPGSLTGPSYIKALHGPFPYIPMMPTGGVEKDNIAVWFKAGAVAVGAGSNLCSFDLARAGKYDEITAIASDFRAEVEKARGQ